MQQLNSKLIAIIVLGIFFSFAGCKCAKNQDYNLEEQSRMPAVQNDFADAFSWSKVYEQKTQQLLITVHLKEGLHAYAAGEKVGVPVTLEISDLNGWRLEGEPSLPAGELKNLDELGTTRVLENHFVVGAKVTGGKGLMRGILKMQLCSATACDRPREHLFEYQMPKESKG